MKKILVLFILCFLLCSCDNESNLSDLVGKEISCSQYQEIKDKYSDSFLIDVRTLEEYNDYHLDDAVNIPVDNILSIEEKIDVEKDTPLIVYCRSGSRSLEAMNMLMEAGFTNVYNLGSINKC